VFSKTPGSETLDSINEALMIGDVREAARLRDEYTKGDAKKLGSLKSSVSRRAPLLGQIGKQDVEPFMAWARTRAPEKALRLQAIQRRYDQAAMAVGLK
jgi:hypothetical protein